MRALLWFLVVAISFAASGCGGGDSDSEDVQVTELQITDEQRFSLSGDWPGDPLPTKSFIVRTDVEWTEVWAARRAALPCSRIPPNGPACAADSPPPVDFSRFTLVALQIASVHYFDGPTPRSVKLEETGGVLRVKFRYIASFTPTPIYTTESRFFLVPKTEARLVVEKRLCEIEC